MPLPDTNMNNRTWFPSDKTLPAEKKEVAVKGYDCNGLWTISGGVWWKPYKGQPHNKGRWVSRDGLGKLNKLPESDDVSEWSYL